MPGVNKGNVIMIITVRKMPNKLMFSFRLLICIGSNAYAWPQYLHVTKLVSIFIGNVSLTLNIIFRYSINLNAHFITIITSKNMSYPTAIRQHLAKLSIFLFLLNDHYTLNNSR